MLIALSQQLANKHKPDSQLEVTFSRTLCISDVEPRDSCALGRYHGYSLGLWMNLNFD